jgi:hypothetical protein
MKRIVFISILCIVVIKSSFSQTFTQGLGLSFVTDKSSAADANMSFVVTYSPRFNFLEKDNSSLSVGIPLSFGPSGAFTTRKSNEPYESERPETYILSIPVILNFNVGAGSSRYNDSGSGFFAGAGFGYHFGAAAEKTIDVISSGYSRTTYNHKGTIGPVVNAGIRIGVGGDTHHFEIKTTYMKGINTLKPNIYSLSVLFNF